eukprot:506468_1
MALCLLMLSILLSIGHADTISNCSATTCSCSSQPCIFRCEGDDACRDGQLNCFAGATCELICGGDGGCNSVTFVANSATDVTITCKEFDACEFSIFDCGTGACSLSCPPSSCQSTALNIQPTTSSFSCNPCAGLDDWQFTASPTNNPTPITPSPTNNLTPAPTSNPTLNPTNNPSNGPTSNPTSITNNPTDTPTKQPTLNPLTMPTQITLIPTTSPSSNIPTFSPIPMITGDADDDTIVYQTDIILIMDCVNGYDNINQQIQSSLQAVIMQQYPHSSIDSITIEVNNDGKCKFLITIKVRSDNKNDAYRLQAYANNDRLTADFTKELESNVPELEDVNVQLAEPSTVIIIQTKDGKSNVFNMVGVIITTIAAVSCICCALIVFLFYREKSKQDILQKQLEMQNTGATQIKSVSLNDNTENIDKLNGKNQNVIVREQNDEEYNEVDKQQEGQQEDSDENMYDNDEEMYGNVNTPNNPISNSTNTMGVTATDGFV